MIDLKIQKEIEQIKKISLTKEEKSKMLHNLSMYANFHAPIKRHDSIFSYLKFHKKFAYVLASVIILILAGGTAVYASENSLPGDLLYPIKIKVIEPVKIALALTPKAKADAEADIGIERLKEAETLDQKGELTPDIKNKLNHSVKNSFSDFFKIKRQLAGTSSDETNQKIQNELDRKLNSHADIFKKLGDELRNSTDTDRMNDINNNLENIETTDNIKNIKKIDRINPSPNQVIIRKSPEKSNFQNN